jgi:hypothetical protein
VLADRRRVVRPARVDDLDLALVDVVVMPVRLSADNLLVQVRADLLGGADDDALAGPPMNFRICSERLSQCATRSAASTRTRAGAP